MKKNLEFFGKKKQNIRFPIIKRPWKENMNILSIKNHGKKICELFAFKKNRRVLYSETTKIIKKKGINMRSHAPEKAPESSHDGKNRERKEKKKEIREIQQDSRLDFFVYFCHAADARFKSIYSNAKKNFHPLLKENSFFGKNSISRIKITRKKKSSLKNPPRGSLRSQAASRHSKENKKKKPPPQQTNSQATIYAKHHGTKKPIEYWGQQKRKILKLKTAVGAASPQK